MLAPTQTHSLTIDGLRKQFLIFDELWIRIDYHIAMCDKQIKRFSKRALFVRYTLPLLTACASGFAGALAGIQGSGQSTGAWLPYVITAASFAATIISAANSAMRPALQYGHYVRYINKFWTEHFQLEIDAESAFLEANGEDNALWAKIHNVVTDHRGKLDAIIEAFSEESVSNIGVPTSDRAI